MTFDLASPAGGYYVCKTYFIVGGRKIRHLGGTNQFKPSRGPRLTGLKRNILKKGKTPARGDNLAIWIFPWKIFLAATPRDRLSS